MEHTGGLFLLYLERLEAAINATTTSLAQAESGLEEVKTRLRTLLQPVVLRKLREEVGEAARLREEAVSALRNALDIRLGAQQRVIKAQQGLEHSIKVLEGVVDGGDRVIMEERIGVQKEALSHTKDHLEMVEVEYQQAVEEHSKAIQHLKKVLEAYRATCKGVDNEALELRSKAVGHISQKASSRERHHRLVGLKQKTMMSFSLLRAVIREKLEKIAFKNLVPVTSGYRIMDNMVRELLRY